MENSLNLNFNDPLFIHPSDTPGMHMINDLLTGVENYGIWSRAMLIALRAKNRIAFIDGSIPRPDVGSSKLDQWERVNALVLSWIMNTVSKDIFCGIVYSTDAHTVWSDLKEQFDKINGSRIFAIHRDIGRLSHDNRTISQYYCKLKQLWDEYSSLVTLPSCECATTKTYMAHDQQLKLLQFLLGLDDSHMSVRTQILMMDPMRTIGQAFSIISQEETHRTLSVKEAPISVFYSAQSRNEEHPKEVLKCDYCNWTGHTKAYCYKLVGYPPGHRIYKQPTKSGRDYHKRVPKEYIKPKKFTAEYNMVDINDGAWSLSTNGSVPVFTSAQYAEILKLLGNNTLHGSAEPSVNMEGPHDWEDNGDW